MRSKKDMMCSCGKRKGACNCKGYAYGSEKIQGYYMGDSAVATPQEQQEMMAMQPGVRMQAPAPTPERPNPMQQAVQNAAMNEAISPVVNYAKDQGSMAINAAKDRFAKNRLGTAAGDFASESVKAGTEAATQAGTEAATQAGTEAVTKGATEAVTKGATEAVTKGATEVAAGGVSSALSGFGGAAAADLLTKGKVDEKTLLKGGLAMGANMLLPGSGFLVGPAMSALGLKDGVMEVPPMGYSDGSRFAMEAAEKSQMSPEEFQKKFIEERVVAPAEAFLEERPMMQAPLLLASAARDYERGKLPLGKFGGGKLEGGKDRLAYRHKKYGEFEVNPESERVSYKKTFRF